MRSTKRNDPVKPPRFRIEKLEERIAPAPICRFHTKKPGMKIGPCAENPNYYYC